MKTKYLLTLLIMLLAFSTTFSTTIYHSGVIDTDENWDLNDTNIINGDIFITNNATLTIEVECIVIVQANIYVYAGATLTIESDVDITISGIFYVLGGTVYYRSYFIRISGTIDAQSNSGNEIVFHEDDYYDGYGWEGIRIHDSATNCVMKYCIIKETKKPNSSGNSIDKRYAGGAIYIEGNLNVDIENCEFDDNESSWGGAICCKNGGSNISIKSNEFHDNTASNGGAVYLNNTDDMRISLNKFYDNSADNSGGAVFLDNSSDNVEFYNNLLNNNNADYGGGLAIDESDPEIYNNTIVYNDADSDGGGCYYDSLNCTLDFRNTIIYSNNANGFSNQLDPNPDYNHSDFTTCCIEGITAWSGNINDDPKFVNSGNHPYRISSDNGTRCIDVGTNGTASEREALDLKDHSRLTRVSAVYARIDIGAYEYEDPTPSYKLTSIGDNFDFKCKLSVYPNPAQNEFFLFFSLNEINDIKYEIVNSFGQQVLYKNLNKLPSGEHTIILDISDLKQGIYFIKLCIGNEKQLVRKLIKKD